MAPDEERAVPEAHEEEAIAEPARVGSDQLVADLAAARPRPSNAVGNGPPSIAARIVAKARARPTPQALRSAAELDLPVTRTGAPHSAEVAQCCGKHTMLHLQFPSEVATEQVEAFDERITTWVWLGRAGAFAATGQGPVPTSRLDPQAKSRQSDQVGVSGWLR